MKRYGLELDATARPTNELTFSARFSYLHARIRNFPNAIVNTPKTIGGVVCACGNVTSVIDASGNPLIRSPEFKVSATGEYVKPIGRDKVGISATIFLSSSYSYTFDNRVRQPLYETLNGRIFWRMSNGLELAAWAKNLTNSVYYQGASIFPDGDGIFFAPPRSFGGEVRFRF